MNLPNVILPTTFKFGDIQIKVASYFQLTDRQAAAIAMHAFRSRKWKKADAKKVHIQLWTGDRETAAMFG